MASTLIERLAELAVRSGANVQPGQVVSLEWTLDAPGTTREGDRTTVVVHGVAVVLVEDVVEVAREDQRDRLAAVSAVIEVRAASRLPRIGAGGADRRGAEPELLASTIHESRWVMMSAIVYDGGQPRMTPMGPEVVALVASGAFVVGAVAETTEAFVAYEPDEHTPDDARRATVLLYRDEPPDDLVAPPGVRVVRTPGHTPHHQSVLVESGGERLCFLGDVIPTAAHLPLPWIMGYDVEPLVTLETKRTYLKRAADEKWLVVFEHDAFVASGRVVFDGRSYTLEGGPGAKGQGPRGG